VLGRLDLRNRRPRLQRAIRDLPRRDRQLALDQAVEIGLEFVRRKIRQKAETPEIDAHERNLFSGEPACGGEECAVAAEHQDRVGFDLIEGHAAFPIQADQFDMALDPSQFGVQKRLDVVAGLVGDDEQAHREG